MGLTAAQPLRWDADAHAVGSIRAVGHGQRLALGQLQPHEDEWVGARNGVLLVAQVALQHLALVAAQLARLRRPGLCVTQWEHEVAEGRNGKLRALVRQVCGRANHGEGRCGCVRPVRGKAFAPRPHAPTLPGSASSPPPFLHPYPRAPGGM